MIFDTFQVALATAIHIAHGAGRPSLYDGSITHSATLYLNLSVAVRCAVLHHTVLINTRQCQTATAEEGALQSTTVHNDMDVATHAASGVVHFVEVASTAEDVAIPRGGAVGANQATIKDDVGIAQHVTIGSTTEDRTINTSTTVKVNIDYSAVNVTIRFKFFIGDIKCCRIIGVVTHTLSAAVHIGVQSSHIQRADNGRTSDIDGALSVHQIAIALYPAHAGKITTAEDIFIYMAATEVDFGVAIDTTGQLYAILHRVIFVLIQNSGTITTTE